MESEHIIPWMDTSGAPWKSQPGAAFGACQAAGDSQPIPALARDLKMTLCGCFFSVQVKQKAAEVVRKAFFLVCRRLMQTRGCVVRASRSHQSWGGDVDWESWAELWPSWDEVWGTKMSVMHQKFSVAICSLQTFSWIIWKRIEARHCSFQLLLSSEFHSRAQNNLVFPWKHCPVWEFTPSLTSHQLPSEKSGFRHRECLLYILLALPRTSPF